MNSIQFTKFLEEIQPITLPFYLDQYTSTNYDLDGVQMKSGNFIIEIYGYCHYNNLTSSFEISINVIDADGNYLDINPIQYRKLKISVINNIITNGTEHTIAF
tara:strand:+ start:3679 stop:3987 length:309 start_codon:yes stop_codon:yes gene_type:complete